MIALPAGARGAPLDDSPLKIIQTSAANFPPLLASEGILEGEVRAVINIDANGRFVDCLITAYTHPEFAREVMTSLRSWEYEPARQGGEAVGTRAELSFAFEARGMVISIASGDSLNMRMNQLMARPPVSLVCKLTELDEPLTATKVVNPRHPGRQLRATHPGGTTTIDFYVDASGRPRMPVVLNASHPWFAAAAVEALSQWQFNLPTCSGRPVAVRVRQEFIFPADS